MENGQINDGHWHLDKRVSVSHLFTTLTIIVAVVFWSAKLENKIDINAFQIEQNSIELRELNASVMTQYGEIIRRLERLDDKSTEHLEQHAEANSN
jgi:hypothetical protein